MPNDTETLVVTSDRLAALRDEAEAAYQRGEIDAELREDLANFVQVEAKDQLEGRPPIHFDFSADSSHAPSISRWRRLSRSWLARLKPRRRSSIRTASISRPK
jgi:hypothetical protein